VPPLYADIDVMLLSCRSARLAAEGRVLEGDQEVSALQGNVSRLEAENREVQGEVAAAREKLTAAEIQASHLWNEELDQTVMWS